MTNFDARAAEPRTTTSQASVTKLDCVVQYHEGLLSAHINQTSIKRVFDELRTKLRVTVNYNDPMTADQTISTFFDTIPLKEGIKNILNGYSYILDVSEDEIILQVLSAPVEAIRVKTLNKPPIAAENSAIELTGEDSKSDDLGYSDDEQEASSDALLEKAVDALHSPFPHLYANAIDELTGLQGTEASEALVDLATRNNLATETRLQVIDSLLQRIENNPSTDVIALDGLRQMAEDGDPNISKTANRVLTELDKRSEMSR
ncbi:MAG: hypothetical protein V3U88_03990 [Methylococcales bacterium]